MGGGSCVLQAKNGIVLETQIKVLFSGIAIRNSDHSPVIKRHEENIHISATFQDKQLFQ